MSNATTSGTPAVHIHEASASPAHLAEICAGLEEEGIPYAIFKATGEAKPLAVEAANRSKLRVGIGITRDFAVMQIRNCPVDIPVADTSKEGEFPILHIKLSSLNANFECRALGTNAARAVKGSAFL